MVVGKVNSPIVRLYEIFCLHVVMNSIIGNSQLQFRRTWLNFLLNIEKMWVRSMTCNVFAFLILPLPIQNIYFSMNVSFLSCIRDIRDELFHSTWDTRAINRLLQIMNLNFLFILIYFWFTQTICLIIEVVSLRNSELYNIFIFLFGKDMNTLRNTKSFHENIIYAKHTDIKLLVLLHWIRIACVNLQ